MTEAARPRWYVEDAVAHQRLATRDEDAEAIRLDVPRWRDLAAAGPAVEGLVVGTGTRALDLAAAMADLARRPEVVLAVPVGGVDPTDWVAACAGWHLAAAPEVGDELVVLRATRDGRGPSLATVTALHHRRAPSRLRLEAPWRVQLLDATAEQWFGSLATSTNRVTLEVAAADPGVAVVRHDPRNGTDAPRLVLTDDPLQGEEDVRVVARPVDLRQFSPVGCDPRRASGLPILPISHDAHPDGVADARAAAQQVAATAADRGVISRADVVELAVTGDGTPPGRDLRQLRDAIALLDHPRVHASAAAHARWLLSAVAAGVPVLLLAPLPGPVSALVGAAVADALATATLDDVLDPDLRERVSVLQRRPVLAGHTAPARLRQLATDLGLRLPQPRAVTVVLATNRETFLEHACRQIARQDWPRLEVVVVTHAAADPAATRPVLDEVLGDLPTTLLHVDADQTLGEALDVGVEHAGGDLVTKFDDDDWYAPEHVTDVVAALDYSGADIAGKAAEFIHLGPAGTTVRRWGRGGERPSTTIAGATLTFPRQVWRDVAGFPHVDVAEDRGFVEAVVAAGGTSYRCHPFGFMVNRHGQHAWQVTEQEFLDDAVATRPGPAHDWSLT